MNQENQDDKVQWEFYVAGVQHHDIYKCVDLMKVDDYLSMELEPTNKYDKNAVRLNYGTLDNLVMIGYVPGKISAEINRLITGSAYQVSCQITEFDKEEKAWKMCKVVVKEERA